MIFLKFTKKNIIKKILIFLIILVGFSLDNAQNINTDKVININNNDFNEIKNDNHFYNNEKETKIVKKIIMNVPVKYKLAKNEDVTKDKKWTCPTFAEASKIVNYSGPICDSNDKTKDKTKDKILKNKDNHKSLEEICSGNSGIVRYDGPLCDKNNDYDFGYKEDFYITFDSVKKLIVFYEIIRNYYKYTTISWNRMWAITAIMKKISSNGMVIDLTK